MKKLSSYLVVFIIFFSLVSCVSHPDSSSTESESNDFKALTVTDEDCANLFASDGPVENQKIFSCALAHKFGKCYATNNVGTACDYYVKSQQICDDVTGSCLSWLGTGCVSEGYFGESRYDEENQETIDFYCSGDIGEVGGCMLNVLKDKGLCEGELVEGS